jgi:hypothetical protein
MPSDTHPIAQQFQIELLRRATPGERLAKSLSLTATMVNLSRQTITRLNPNLDSQQVNLKCVELYYGKELAARMRDYLKRESPDVAV